MINFLGRTSDWEGWSENFLARSKKKGYKKLLTGKENIPTAKVKKKAEMIKLSERSEAKEFGNVAADEEYKPTDDESIKEVGF